MAKRPENILAISGGKVTAIAWGLTRAPVFSPQLETYRVPRYEWAKTTEFLKKIRTKITAIQENQDNFDLVLIDYSVSPQARNAAGLVNYIAGFTACPSIMFVRPRSWSVIYFGTDAALVQGRDDFDLMIREYAKLRFPFHKEAITCDQPARALTMAYWGWAKFASLR